MYEWAMYTYYFTLYIINDLHIHYTRTRLCLLISKSFYMERSLLAGQQLICSCKCFIYYTKGFESIFYNIICICVKFHNVTFWSELPVIFSSWFPPLQHHGRFQTKDNRGHFRMGGQSNFVTAVLFDVKYKYEIGIVILLYKVFFIGCIYSLLTNLNWFD